MTDVNDSHSSTGASSGKENSGKKSTKLTTTQRIKKLESENNKLKNSISEQDEAYLNSQNLDGVFGMHLPGTDAYAIKYWARMYGVDTTTVCKWIKKFKIPYIGGEMKTSFITTQNIMNCLQQTYEEPDGEKAKQKE